MDEGNLHRIRLKLPGGAEFEAEGTPEFVQRERSNFLDRLGHQSKTGPATASQDNDIGQPNISWDAITESKGSAIQLRAKLIKGEEPEKDACLVLLAASHKILNQPKPTATQLAKWLRRSGYPILRMDRALQDAVARGEILSSGSRRARRYELTAHGRLKAYILANQLTAAITGKA